MADAKTDLKTTPLDSLHRELGARMVPFAGYAMPVQYPSGIIKEHTQCRTGAVLFDVSHMGQIRLDGADAAEALETLVPGDIKALKPGRQRYSLFTDHNGGILDDLMIANAGDHLFLVVNAACKAQDLALLEAGLDGRAVVTAMFDRGLLALQGPKAADVLAKLNPEVATMRFMDVRPVDLGGIATFISRSGYTGEDGYEISVAAEEADNLARMLLDLPDVMPAGLGARDTLRLEAGLCLYGNDIDVSISPIEADLAWTIGKRRREEGGFPGSGVILRELKEGAKRQRVGIRISGRAPARAHTKIVDEAGFAVGEVTSGGFAPTVGGPIAMGYVAKSMCLIGTSLRLMVRDKPVEGRVSALPFVPQRYYKPPAGQG